MKQDSIANTNNKVTIYIDLDIIKYIIKHRILMLDKAEKGAEPKYCPLFMLATWTKFRE
ncbi:hypothetical protein ACFLYB_04460 [Chloroflexota bacterium]